MNFAVVTVGRGRKGVASKGLGADGDLACRGEIQAHKQEDNWQMR